MVPLACTATVSRPADADPGVVESAPAAPGTPCEGLDESTCTRTAGCALGRGVEILQTPRGPCRGEYKFAGCQTEDTSGVELPAAAAACGPNGQEFYFGRVQDTPDGWDQHRCTRPLADFDAAPLCPGVEVPAPTAEEQAFATRQRAGEAINAYVAALDALRLGNTSQYLDVFAEDMTCFYGATKDAKRRLVRARRKGAADGEALLYATEVVSASDERVVFVDFGIYTRVHSETSLPPRSRPYVANTDEPIEQGTHAKLVVMETTPDGWRVQAETRRDDRSCADVDASVDVEPPSLFASCQAQHAAALDECDQQCDSPTPGNACNVCPDDAWCELQACLHIKPLPGERCG